MIKFLKKLAAVAISLSALLLFMPASVYADGIDGVVVNDGIVTGYNGAGGAVVIPEGATTISAGAFSGKSLVTSIIIPSSVTIIESNAFENCTGLSSVSIPGSVQNMGIAVFRGCTGLSSVSLQAKIPNIPDDTFNGCTSLASVAVAADITSIGARAFKGCRALSTMTVPYGMTSVGSEAFADCVSMTGISIPATTTSIAGDAFRGCASLTTIAVDESNGTYASDGGCLYNASKTKLLVCPAGKTKIALSSSTRILGSGCFNGCYSITSVTLPSGATGIENDALTGSGITTITIPASVTSIGTQRNWTPEVIYGYTKSAADSYASDNEYVFYPLDGNKDETDYDSDTFQNVTTGAEEVVDADDADDDDDMIKINIGTGDGHGKPDSTSKPSGNTGNNGGTTVKPNTGNGNNTGNGYTTTTGNEHVQDKTPKTGEYLNSRIWICAAFVLVGIALFILAKRKRKE